MKIYEKATNEPQFKIGLNQNYYVFCKIKEPLIQVSTNIGKSQNSIYFNEKYNVFAIRVKQKHQKNLLLQMFKKEMH